MCEKIDSTLDMNSVFHHQEHGAEQEERVISPAGRRMEGKKEGRNNMRGNEN